MDDSPQVALWYWRYRQIDYELFDSEDEAATAAFYMEDDGRASVAGVQFADGRIIEQKKWTALNEATRQILAAERADHIKRQAEPPRPTRKVRAPFADRIIEIDVDSPPWIGQSSEE